LPWTPPGAALAIVPTMTTANAMRKILSGFMGSVSAGRPTNTIGRTASSGGIGRKVSRTRLAERLVWAAASGDDSQPFTPLCLRSSSSAGHRTRLCRPASDLLPPLIERVQAVPRCYEDLRHPEHPLTVRTADRPPEERPTRSTPGSGWDAVPSPRHPEPTSRGRRRAR
jgi:hypothetical protein